MLLLHGHICYLIVECYFLYVKIGDSGTRVYSVLCIGS